MQTAATYSLRAHAGTRGQRAGRAPRRQGLGIPAAQQQQQPQQTTQHQQQQQQEGAEQGGSSVATAHRRSLLAAAAAATAAAVLPVPEAEALPGFKKDLTPRRKKQQIDTSLYEDGPEGLKYYDITPGNGPEAKPGNRVVVHFDAKWRGVTFITTRQGQGVTGGEPYGFDLGSRGIGSTLKGLDLGVQGMRLGGRRKLLVPPELAYGDKGAGEIPPGATLEFDVELLSLKSSASSRIDR